MFSPRGSLPQRLRGPNPSGTKPPDPLSGGGVAADLQRKPAPVTPQGMPQRFSGQETVQWMGSQRINVRVTLHRADPRQVKEKMNLLQEQKVEPHTHCWDNAPGSAGPSGPKPPAPTRTAEQNLNAEKRYTPESASSILASFGLSNEDLEELSRYPDEQLTPENMPLILREIRIRKIGRCLSGLLPLRRGEETVGGVNSAAVKSKVIDYGHASKYGYTEDPLEARTYNPEVPTEDALAVRVCNPETSSRENREEFRREQNMLVSVAPSRVQCNPVFPAEDLIKPTGFQNNSSNIRPFFPAATVGKVSGLCPTPIGLHVVKSIHQPVMLPIMPPIMAPIIPPLAQPMISPVMSSLVQQPLTQHVIPSITQPHFSAEVLVGVSQHERITHEAGTSQLNTQSSSGAGQKPFQSQAQGPVKSPFGIVKASWLPAFLQSDAEKIKVPTPSMMNDYYATSPRIFPHMCSLCNVECTHMKDWILHQNTPSHIESCRQLRQQYPDWNPESHSSKRNDGDRKENQSPRRRSSSSSPSPSPSPSPRRSRVSGSSYVRRSRSRSRSPCRFRPTRARSRSPWQSRRFSSRYRSRSQQRSRYTLRSSPRRHRSPSSDRSSRRRSTRSRGRTPRSTKKSGKTSSSSKSSKKDVPSVSGSSSSSPEKDDLAQSNEMEEEEEDLSAGTSGPSPTPYNRLLREELLSCGTVLQITDLPDDGFSDQDIKKIVQPFGKVSDLVVIRSRNEAFLEMNYKEAVIAAVKYAETVPVLLNGKQVKISVAEKPKTPPGQAKMNVKKRAPSIKKAAPSTKKDKTTSKTTKSVTSKKERTRKSSTTGDSKSKKTSNTAAKSSDEDLQLTTEAEMETPSDPKNVTKGDGSTEPVKTVETQAKGAASLAPTPGNSDKPAQVPPVVALDLQVNEAVNEKKPTAATTRSEEAAKPAPKELEDVCVVLISNLADKGYSVEEISNLARPFGGLRDVLILSSHKKAYLEMNQKSADSMVKFYTCFPRFLDGNQLCINMVPQFKTIKDEEAIFTAIIKKSDAKVNAETIHSQFVHLGNLPDDGYRELEVVCVGLRFGQVDNYIVLKNRNKAILQLDSSQSARSMYSFLKQYPYNMGTHTLTCSLSPSGEPPEAELVKSEVKTEEPSEGSSDLKVYPEASGVAQTAAANPPVQPSVAKKGPVPVSHGKDKMAAVQIESSESLQRAVRESAPRPAEMSLEKEDAGVEAPVASVKSADTEPSDGKSEEMPLPSSSVEKEEVVNTEPELLESAVVSTSEKEIRDEELSAPAAEPPEELRDAVKAEDVPPGCAVKLPGCAVKPTAEESTGPIPEALPPASDAASVEVVSAVITQANKLDSPEKTPVAAQTKYEMPVTQSPEKSPVVKTGLATEKQLDVAGAGKEMKPEEPVLKVGRAVEGNPEKLLVKTGTETEKKPERFVARVGAAAEKAAGAVSESSKGGLIKVHPNKGPRPAKTGGTCRAVTLNPSLSVKKSSSVGKMILKAVVSLPDISKSRIPMWRNKPPLCKGGEQKAPLKPESQGQAAVEKNTALKEEDHPRAGGSRSILGDRGRKCAVSRSAAVGGKGGNGRKSSLQEKDSRVKTRASSKQSQEGENRPSTKKDKSSNKACVGGSAKPLKRGASGSAKQKEEEELFPFNLDEFVTVDEVVEEIESPVKKRRNPLKRKRKNVAKNPLERNPKRRKVKGSVAHVAESKQSFVTLDEIGEEEDVAAQLMAVTNLEALSDPQSLVVVDEVIEEEELMAEAVKDPQSLVTLDELCEQEELGSQKGGPRAGFEEQGLKAEPLVTVDEIGEVEELPLNEPTELNMEEVLKHREEEKVATEDTGDGASSQVPDDPSALVTVDEIQEDNEENPLMTLDEVNEEDDDFLADFNRLKEELNFVTVDEVGEEDEEEENTLPGKKLKEDEDIVTVAGPEKEDIAAAAGLEKKDIVAVAGPEQMEIVGDRNPEEKITAVPNSKGQVGSRGRKRVPKRKKMAAPTVSKAPSAPKVAPDLDYLVPKAGFFCQICSLFYAKETSVKNHYKTLLHQQNMEKFMAKQKAEGNGGQERSSR
ncbi:zinc finger protein 638 isoform 2-T2 [Rhynochetos jubatus]